MKVELMGGTSKEELEKRIRMLAASGKLSEFPGNVFECYESRGDFSKDLALVKRIIGSGHKSIIEHDYLVFAICDVTPIVEQTIIGNRLTSFTIKSRRYVDFSTAGFYTPNFRNSDYSLHLENKELQKKYRKHTRFLNKEYSAFLEAGIPKEDARFLFPYSFYSNIVMGVDARELEKLVIYLLHGDVSKIQELHDLGEKFLTIIKKYLPYLDAEAIANYGSGDVDKYSFKTSLNKYKKNIEILRKPLLIDYTASPDDTLAQLAVMYETQCNFDEAPVIIAEEEKVDPDFKEKFISEIFSRDEARELEQISFTFQIPISLAVLTHLTRHRMHSLMVPSFVPMWDFNNYITPDTVKEAGLEERYKKAIVANMNLFEEFKNAGVVDEDLIYFYLAAQMCNVVTTINARSLMWISRVRCCNRAQWEIRRIINTMTSEVKKVAPIIGKGFGPTCVINRTCTERKSCGLLQKLLEKDAESTK